MAMLQQQLLDLGTLLSSLPPSRQQRPTPSARCWPAHPQTFRSPRCRGANAVPVESCGVSGNSDGDTAPKVGRSLASCGRRRLALTMLVPLIFPQHHMAKAVDAGESSIIQNEVRSILTKGRAAGMLRLAFHDAGTFDVDGNSGGMNGSIVYELDRPESAGLSKSVKALSKAKMEIEKKQQGIRSTYSTNHLAFDGILSFTNHLAVSWADLIAVAGSEAVALCGGPAIPVQLGRLDVSMPDPEGRMPQETLDASGLKNCFSEKGFSTQELVALSGAHTIGSKGFGSPVVFDNAYFKILVEKPWRSTDDGMSNMIGLPSDRAIADDEECSRWIRIYASDQSKFFDDFKSAYIKLVNSGAEWRTV